MVKNKQGRLKNKQLGVVGLVGLLLIGATAAVGFLSTGFTKWDANSWKEKLIPVKEPAPDEETPEPVSEDVEVPA